MESPVLAKRPGHDKWNDPSVQAKKIFGGTSWWCSGYDSEPLMQGAQVRELDPTSHN